MNWDVGCWKFNVNKTIKFKVNKNYKYWDKCDDLAGKVKHQPSSSQASTEFIASKTIISCGFLWSDNLAYENLDLGPWMNLIIDSLITWSEFLDLRQIFK